MTRDATQISLTPTELTSLLLLRSTSGRSAAGRSLARTSSALALVIVTKFHRNRFHLRQRIVTAVAGAPSQKRGGILRRGMGPPMLISRSARFALYLRRRKTCGDHGRTAVGGSSGSWRWLRQRYAIAPFSADGGVDYTGTSCGGGFYVIVRGGQGAISWSAHSAATTMSVMV